MSASHSSRRGALGVVLALVAGGCRCGPGGASQLQPAQLTATPSPLVLPRAYVRQTTRAAVQVANVGEATASEDVFLDAPFAAAASQLRLAGGDAQPLEVTFAPSQPGHFSAVLRVGVLEVPVEAAAEAVPACLPPASVCEETRFDVSAGLCVASLLPDATACNATCVTGQCQGGTCVGTSRSCDDGDACTTDACSEAWGCTSLRRKRRHLAVPALRRNERRWHPAKWCTGCATRVGCCAGFFGGAARRLRRAAGRRRCDNPVRAEPHAASTRRGSEHRGHGRRRAA